MLQPMLPLRVSLALADTARWIPKPGQNAPVPMFFLHSSCRSSWDHGDEYVFPCDLQFEKKSYIFSGNAVNKSPAGHERSSTASNTSDEKFKLAKTLSFTVPSLSSKQMLSWLIRLLSDVGLMTMMRGTPRGNMGEIFPKFMESKESLLWLLSLSFSPLPSEISLVRLWLRLRARTNKGRVATVRELETSSCSQVLSDSFMAHRCWRWKKERMKGKYKKHKTIQTQAHTFLPYVLCCSLVCGLWSPAVIVSYMTCLCLDACMTTCFWRIHLTPCPKVPALHLLIPTEKNRAWADSHQHVNYVTGYNKAAQISGKQINTIDLMWNKSV